MSIHAVARLAVAMLIALVLPIQATAGAVAGLCMALGHHGDAVAMDHSIEGAPHAHDGHDHGSPQSNGTEGGHCSPCAACCGVASISGLPDLSIDAAASFAPVSDPVSHFAGRLPERLDRPPLSL
jgi:hypothetical protein